MFLFEYGDDIIVIDCGIGFPEEDQLGIDLVLPDISYLRQRKDKIRAIFITHGHEDHIGALPYLLPDIPAPVYASRLTLGLIATKLEDGRRGVSVRNPKLIELNPDSDEKITAGVFKVEPFRVTHSIPDALGFAIDTPNGLIVHSSDFKLDPTPIDGRLTDIAKLERFRKRGVNLLISDCVHIEAAGRTPSESVIGETYDAVFGRANGRILIATFASLIARVQQVIDVAARHNRRVATLGRSMEKNVRVALELGYLQDPNRVLIETSEAKTLADDRIVYVVTGSQGEPMSALSRIANRDHREVAIDAGDTVIISATPIPGNETSVYRIINKLFRSGAEVIYQSRALVHVSGHASRDEIIDMLRMVGPRHVLPFHGEHRHMALYADIAVENGIPPGNITFAECGDVIEITEDRVRVTDHVEAGFVYVDGMSVGSVGEPVIRDRQALAQDGILMVVVSVDRQTGQIVAGPEIVTRGFAHGSEAAALIESTRRQLLKTLSTYTDGHQTDDRSYLSRQIRDATANHLFRETKRRPMILPMVMEV